MHVQQDARVHGYGEGNVASDAGDGRVMVTPENLEVCPAASTGCRGQHGQIVRRLLGTVQSGLRQRHPPCQIRWRVSTLGGALQRQLGPLLHRDELVARVQPTAIYQQVRPTGCLCNESNRPISDLVTMKNLVGYIPVSVTEFRKESPGT